MFRFLQQKLYFLLRFLFVEAAEEEELENLQVAFILV